MPRGHSCTVSVCHVGILMTCHGYNGPKGLFKRQNFLKGPIYEFFFYRDENLNEPYLQGRFKYLSHITILVS